MLIVYCSLFAICCLMFGSFGSLRVARCCSFVVRCVVCGVWCVLFVCLFALWSSLVICRLLLVVCYLL